MRQAAPTPRLLIRRLVLEDVEVPLEQVGTSRIVCTNLSDAPQGAGLPVTIVVTSNEKKVSLEIKCEYDAPEPAAAISATFEDVDLRELQGRLNRSNPILFEGGVATARINGKVSRDIIDLSIGVKTKGMKARSTGAGAFGLDSEVTGEAMKLLENFETKLRLVGPLNEPRLVFDETALSDEMKKALVRAGKEQLASRIGGLAGDKLLGGADVGKVLERPKDAVKDVLGGLLGGNDKKDRK